MNAPDVNRDFPADRRRDETRAAPLLTPDHSLPSIFSFFTRMLDPSTSVVVPLVASLSLSEPTDYSLRVAPELLSQFFEFLATDIYGRQALLAASRVCRRWRDPAQRERYTRTSY